jgi:aminopeptidase N
MSNGDVPILTLLQIQEHSSMRSRAFYEDDDAFSHPIDYTVVKQEDLRKPFDSISYKKVGQS